MHPALLFLSLLYGLILAGFAFVPGVIALAVVFATRGGTGSGFRQVVHVVCRKSAIVLLAISCGFVGAGIFSLGLNLLLLALIIASPEADWGVKDDTFSLAYGGLLLLSFLVSFSLGLGRVRRWLYQKIE